MAKKLEVKPGIYRHYKNDREYQVLFTAQAKGDNGEEVVVYQSLDDKQVWTRPAKNFLAHIDADGDRIARFTWVRGVELDDWSEKYKRALADYQNLVKQAAKEKQEFARYANEQLLLEIIPVYDNLKTSLAHVDAAAEKNGWLQGVQYVIKQLAEVLKNFGVEEIKTVGENFDHHVMDAMDKEETADEKLNNTVAKEIMSGYKMGEKVIRAAKVIVYEKK